MYTTIWKYTVPLSSQKAFEEFYGETGQWVKLFQSSKGYIDTKLLKDTTTPNQYLTIDTWDSQESYEEFLQKNKTQYHQLDTEAENLTTFETKIGHFIST